MQGHELGSAASATGTFEEKHEVAAKFLDDSPTSQDAVISSSASDSAPLPAIQGNVGLRELRAFPSGTVGDAPEKSQKGTDQALDIIAPEVQKESTQPEEEMSTKEILDTPTVFETLPTVNEPLKEKEVQEEIAAVEKPTVQESSEATSIPAVVESAEEGNAQQKSAPTEEPEEPTVQTPSTTDKTSANGDEAKVQCQSQVEVAEVTKNVSQDSAAQQDGSMVARTLTENGDGPQSPPVEESSRDVVDTSTVMEPAKENGQDASSGKVDELKILQEMRVKVAELDPLSKDTDEATLRRFLRARSWKLSKAVKMFVDHQKWRRSFVPLGHIPQEEIKNELDAEKVFLQGHDKEGRPIAVILAAKHDVNKRKFDEFKRSVVFYFDMTMASMKPGEETFTVILDLKSLGYKNLDVRGWISTFDFLQAYYPETLGRLFIIHVPKLFWGAWKVVYPFIDKVTRDKIVFVEDKHLEQKLQEEIDVDQVPDVYGGKLPLVPIQNAVVPSWPPKQPDALQKF